VRALEIAPFTKAATLPTVDDVVGTASRVLGVFGGAYRTVTFEVPLTLFDVTVGTTLVLTSSKFLGGDGTKGVVGRAGILIGKTWEPMDARGQFTVLVPAGDFAGYVPEARLSATFTGSSGTVTVNSADLPASTTAATWWEGGRSRSGLRLRLGHSADDHWRGDQRSGGRRGAEPRRRVDSRRAGVGPRVAAFDRCDPGGATTVRLRGRCRRAD
jgi:hypothetical protein